MFSISLAPASAARRRPLLSATALAIAIGAACGGRGQERPAIVRLVDAFTPNAIEGTVAPVQGSTPRAEWRFDGAPPAPPSKTFAATRGDRKSVV